MLAFLNFTDFVATCGCTAIVILSVLSTVGGVPLEVVRRCVENQKTAA